MYTVSKRLPLGGSCRVVGETEGVKQIHSSFFIFYYLKVLRCRLLPGKVLCHAAAYKAVPQGLVLIILSGGFGGVEQFMRVVIGEGVAAAGVVAAVEGNNGVLQAACLAHYGNGAVAHGYHLRKAAGLKQTRRKEYVRAGKYAAGKRIVVFYAGGKPAGIGSLRVSEKVFVAALPRSQHSKLNWDIHKLL